jgi:NTP pyrophosphatase (non-canonical NTP hydrolase)
MDFARFRELNTARVAYFGREHSPAGLVACLAEELGEVAECVSGLTGEKERKEHLTVRDLGDELADLFTYMDLLAARYGIDLEAAIARKFDVVSARVAFPERLR